MKKSRVYYNEKHMTVSGNRRDNGEWIYGINPVFEALRAGRRIKTIFIAAGRHEKTLQIRTEAEKRGITLRTEDSGFFDRRFPKGHQGVAALGYSKGYISLDELLTIPEQSREDPLFLLLDCIEDPRNLGGILRSADAAGIHGVVIQSHRSAGLGPEVSKTSAGAVEYVPLCLVANIKHALSKLKDRGITVVGAEASAGVVMWEVDLTGPLALVIGSEGKGMRRTVREHCDLLVRLPMRGNVNSLNVSVAGGILLYEVLRQRSAARRSGPLGAYP